MSIEKLVKEYSQKLAEASTQQQNKDVSRLSTEYLTEVSKLKNVEVEIAQALSKIVSEPCMDNRNLWILAAQLHPSGLYFDYANAMLMSDDVCIWHEGIIELAQLTKDSRYIESLEELLSKDLQYDTDKAVAVRALEAIAEIGTPEAVDILKRNLASPFEQIREEAEIMLDSLSESD